MASALELPRLGLSTIKLQRLRRLLDQSRPLQLAPGETFRIRQSLDPSTWLRLDVETGVGRLSASFGETRPDITLAFCGANEPEWLRWPDGASFQIEALTAMRLHLHHGHGEQDQPGGLPSTTGPGQRELITEWLLDLHLVRHPVGADARLASLLRLLVARFGIRTAEGYRLPFSLGHARLAELICATRSTVTRRMLLLRQQEQIRQEGAPGSMLFLPSFVEGTPELRRR